MPQLPLPRRIVRSQAPTDMGGVEGYRKARDQLRQDFGFRCGYCMIHEQQVGGAEGFCTDHFRPRSKGGLVNDYANLYWACIGCNRFKGDTWPTELESRQGRRFADPCNEQDYGIHFVEDHNGRLVHRTPCGEYHVLRLRLNRPSRAARRRERNEVLDRLREALDLMQELDLEIRDADERGLVRHIRREAEALQTELAIAIPLIPLMGDP